MGKKIKKEFLSGKFKFEEIGIVNYNQQKPKISLEFLSGDYCISECEMREKAEIIDTLHRLSFYTWQDLHQLGKNGSGYEQFDLSQLRCSIPKDERFRNLDKVTIFHKKKKIPIIGFRINDVYYVFCIDRTFDAYDHGGS